MEALQTLYENNPGITSRQLYIKAVKEGVGVTKANVENFVKSRGEQQVFQQRKASQGETAPTDENQFQMDLIDYKQSKSGKFKNILVLVKVFTREVFLKATTGKKGDAVARALTELLDRAGPVKVISSDQGLEFINTPVSRLLERRNIVHRIKDKGDRNALAVTDRLIQTLKQRLSKALTAKNKSNWDQEIKNVEQSYNSTSHGHLMGESPKDVNPVVKFKLYQQSAEAIENNNERNKQETAKLEATQKFRPPLPRKDFERSFKPRFGEIQTVQSIEAGVVTDQQGKQHLLKNVQIVKPESTEVRPPDLGSRGSKLKPGLRPFAEALKPLLRAGPVALNRAARLLNQEEGFQEARGNLTFKEFLKLFPEFKVTGSRQQSKVELR